MTRNIINAETAMANPGALTFNAFPPDDYDGIVFTVAALRLGEHAHLDIDTGRSIPLRPGQVSPRSTRSKAGHLILRWSEWALLRDLFDSVPWVRIAEVQEPTPNQLEHYL